MQLRVVIQVEDFDHAAAFFRDSLGLSQEVVYPGTGQDARVMLLEAGRATLELVNAAQARGIDAVEGVEQAEPPRVRLAFEVEDAAAVTDRLVGAGGRLVAAPVVTPWGSVNSRLEAPGDVQLTLFEQREAE